MEAIKRNITPRQLEVIRGICKGHKSAEIGKQMGISLETVEVHRYNAYRILGVSNAAQLMVKALQHRFVRYSHDKGIFSVVLGALLLCASLAWAGDSKLDGETLTLTLNTKGTHHTTAKGSTVFDSVHGTLPDGSRFQARVYRPASKTKVVKIVPCSTDADCEAKNP